MLPLLRRCFVIYVALIRDICRPRFGFSACRADFGCSGTVAAYEPPPVDQPGSTCAAAECVFPHCVCVGGVDDGLFGGG
jgi:hypothetical protein